MIEDLKIIIDNHGLFLILFFSGVLFGVVAQKMVDNKPVKPYMKRIAVAGMTMSITLSLNKIIGHLSAEYLYPWSPVIGFFGEAILETINQKRYGISTGFLELLLERLGFVKRIRVMIMEKHRRSRKLAFLMLALIFLNSVLTLKLRSYQRRQNLDLLRSRLRNESNREIFDSIEKKSKTEDMLLLIGTNIVALIIIAGFDRQRVIDENKDKERAVKVFGR